MGSVGTGNIVIAPKKRVRRDWWKRGRALDLWSIPHFLFGILMAMLPPLAGMPLFSALLLTLVLGIGWEFYEKLAGIKETTLNGIFDVILPVVAFTGTSFLLLAYQFHYDDLVVITVAVALLYGYTNLSGWLAYRRRHRAFFMR